MKILLDECLPARLKNVISGHDVSTTQEMGWGGKSNGELLTLASKDFDVFLTSDRNLSFQQSLKKFTITVAILHGKSNAFDDLEPLIPKFVKAIRPSKPGQLLHIH